jgi:NAD(P)-dependent dehydrogenase (short-subunit alcohol dehydrogenase family)
MTKTVLVTGSSYRADKEAAATVAFLMLERAAYITRQMISVSGGLC